MNTLTKVKVLHQQLLIQTKHKLGIRSLYTMLRDRSFFKPIVNFHNITPHPYSSPMHTSPAHFLCTINIACQWAASLVQSMIPWNTPKDLQLRFPGVVVAEHLWITTTKPIKKDLNVSYAGEITRMILTIPLRSII